MKEANTTESKGLKWVLRLFAPLCLGLILVLGWQVHEEGRFCIRLFDEMLCGEPVPSLVMMMLRPHFALIFGIPASLTVWAAWALEKDRKVPFAAALAAATFLSLSLLAWVHYELHWRPYHIMSTENSQQIAPSELKCSICKGFDSRKNLIHIRNRLKKEEQTPLAR
ncbi:MAG: hypothetical protein RL095_4142 [Verrucomicrobiota bacterium]|jgi:hypothetical protein